MVVGEGRAMLPALLERDTADGARLRHAKSRRLPDHWPLSIVLLGFPAWWILGLAAFAPLLVALPMAWMLARRKSLRIPRGFGWWLLFLVWVAGGVFLLFADAPNAVPGGGGVGRLFVYGNRAAWYFACTVVMLWVLNSDREQLSVRRFSQIFGFIFVLTTAGGLIAMRWPELDLTSPFEMLLPKSLVDNGFVFSLVHLHVADMQTVLGDPQPRPKMPFPYANTWGSVISLTLPFFLAGWLKFGRPWQRWVAPFVLAAAAVPIVYSLNRGLWLSLTVGVALLVVLQLRTGRPAVIGATIFVGIVAVIALLTSPLTSMVESRLDNPHSNDRRLQLLTTTVESTIQGSPIAGFGSTRDVQGSFASIAGGSTPDCPACGVPPLGTQGQIWLVIFSQGMIGLVLFLAFFYFTLKRVWRCRSIADTLCLFVLVFFALQLFVYDTLDLPLYTVMAVIGLAWREQNHERRRSHGVGIPLSNLGDILRRLRRGLVPIVVATAVGALLGYLVTAGLPAVYSAKADVLLAPTPRYLASFAGASGSKADNITIDTEAALVFSQRTLEQVPERSRPEGLNQLREDINVTAPPNTSILTIEIRGDTPEQAEARVEQVIVAYLSSRNDYLELRREEVLSRLDRELEELNTAVAVNDSIFLQSQHKSAMSERKQEVQEAIGRLILTGTQAGEVVSTDPARSVRTQVEVPVVSGALIGFAALAVLAVTAPGAIRLRSARGVILRNAS